MLRTTKLFCFVTCLVLVAGEAGGQTKGTSGSRPTTPKPSGPKFSSPNSTPKPAPKPTPKPEPKFSAPSVTPKVEAKPEPKFSAPKTESKGTGNTADSRRPVTGTVSDKARANKEETSRTRYEEAKRASAPPKPTYKTADGKEVKVRTESKQVEAIRNRPSTEIQPEVRKRNTETHIHNHHYNHDYGWYASQPVVYVGAGYSSAFWWMMMTDWDANRRAEWLYHNRHNIESDAYERGLRDAEVSRRIAQLEAEKRHRDADYVDPEFTGDPSLMYDQEYVESAYNPTVVRHDPDPEAGLFALKVFGYLLLAGLTAAGLYWFLCVKRWGK